MPKIEKMDDNSSNHPSSSSMKKDFMREAFQSADKSKIVYKEIAENDHFDKILKKKQKNISDSLGKENSSNNELIKKLLENCTQSRINELEKNVPPLTALSEISGFISEIQNEIKGLDTKKQNDIKGKFNTIENIKQQFPLRERESTTVRERIEQMQAEIASQYKLEEQILSESKKIYENNLWAIKMKGYSCTIR